MATFLKPDRPSGWQNQVYNGQYGREDMARMDPAERRAMIQRFSDSHTDGSNPDLNSFANRTHDIGGIFGPNIFGRAAEGIQKVKGKYGKNKSGDAAAPVAGSSKGDEVHTLERYETQDSLATAVDKDDDDEKKGGVADATVKVA